MTLKFSDKQGSAFKLCIIYNTAPRYREAIFQSIDKTYDCDWYFGETKTDIKEMDLSLLKNTKYYKTYGDASSFYWKKGILSLLFKRKYQTFLMLSESRSLLVMLGILFLEEGIMVELILDYIVKFFTEVLSVFV